MAAKYDNLTPPPHNIEAEEAVLGGILVDSAYLPIAHSILDRAGEDFYIVKHRWIFDVFVHLESIGSEIDLITVREELSRRDQLNEIGGPAYLTRLITLTATAFNVKDYAKLVKEQSQRRRLLHGASEIAKLAYDQGTSIDEVMSNADKVLFDTNGVGNFDRRTRTFAQVATDLRDTVADARKNGPPDNVVIPTGFTDLDEILDGGIWREDYIVIAADTGGGKSAMASSMAMNVAGNSQKRPHIWTGEMKDVSYMQRMLASLINPADAPVASRSILLGKLNDEQFKHFSEGVDEVNKLHGYINDFSNVNIDVYVRHVKRLARLGLIDMVIADYLQLMQGTYGKNYISEVKEYSDVSSGLKEVTSGEFGVPVVALAQFNRAAGSKKRPNKHDLKNTSKIEQDSTGVWLIWDESSRDVESIQEYLEIQEASGNAPIYPMSLIVDKQRAGRVGMCKLGFWRGRASFVNLESDRVQISPEASPVSIWEPSYMDGSWETIAFDDV